ncbi:MAG: D-aminoacylase [Candidatus Abyssobacteria bacterium SURF_5]|uniref:D-aminoacylase n=1 Tax=Abyssobacteria bacterium (strain SURF_5) TaxID=2093360 RepID=A0A3A4NKI8_ABYX5|nr:MAG: D-aminoacylase [Candidatus Abyssubacteria bacterium SURF_5]
MMFDLLIQNVQVLDGLGKKEFHSDIAVKGDEIAEIGNLAGAEAKRVLNGKGLHISPGFIDVHTHSEFLYPLNPNAESKVHQGVTTEIIGHCGISAAPMFGDARREAESLTKMIGIDISWSNFSEYTRQLHERGIALNVIHLLGHGALRDAVMGRTDREPTDDEIRRMQTEIDRAFEQGAWGMSTGLIYPPGIYSTTKELIELNKAVARNGGIYSTHVRGEGATLLKAFGEAIEIGECAGVPVQISHIKAAGKNHWPLGPKALEKMQKALEMGMDIAADMYPYTAGHTELSALLPYWMHNEGNQKLLERLRDPAVRDRIKTEMMRGGEEFSPENLNGGYDGLFIGLSLGHPEYQGKTVKKISEELKKDPADTIMDIILECNCVAFVNIMDQSEDNVRMFIQHPKVMIGSDASAMAPYGMLGMVVPHPRTYGTFPRVLARYVRQEKILSLPEAIRKMTSLPAARWGISDRGVIGRGKKADLVVFDAGTIEDRATYENPNQYPVGIRAVVVNGKIVVENDEHTGELPGRVLTR